MRHSTVKIEKRYTVQPATNGYNVIDLHTGGIVGTYVTRSLAYTHASILNVETK